MEKNFDLMEEESQAKTSQKQMRLVDAWGLCNLQKGEFWKDFDNGLSRAIPPMSRESARFLAHNDPRTPVSQLCTEIYHGFLRRVFIIWILQFLVTVGGIYLLSYHAKMDVYAAKNHWLYGISITVLVVLSLLYCSGMSRNWKDRSQLLLTICVPLVTAIAVAAFMDSARAQLILHSMGILLFLLVVFALFTCQHKITFSFYLAILFSILVGALAFFILVYMPERSHVDTILSFGNLSNQGWHFVWVIIVGTTFMVLALLALKQHTQYAMRFEYHYVSFLGFYQLVVLRLFITQVAGTCATSCTKRSHAVPHDHVISIPTNVDPNGFIL